jgi:hypothetical protein
MMKRTERKGGWKTDGWAGGKGGGTGRQVDQWEEREGSEEGERRQHRGL